MTQPGDAAASYQVGPPAGRLLRIVVMCTVNRRSGRAEFAALQCTAGVTCVLTADINAQQAAQLA